MRTRSARPRLVALAPGVVLVVTWLLLLPALGSYANADAVSYASLAQDWAAGRIGEAVNGYWAPLLPLLAAPLVALGVDSILALRVVLLGAGLAVIPVLGDLARRCGGGTAAVRLVHWAAAAFLVRATASYLFVDLLPALLLLLFVRSALDARVRAPGAAGVRVAVVAGLWGGLAYLSKAVALPVVVALVPVVALLHLGLCSSAASRRRVVGAAAGTAATVAAVAVPWALAISLQAGTPTVSTAATYNAALVAEGSSGDPLNRPGFYPPPSPSAVSVWKDPARIAVTGLPDAGALAEAVDPADRPPTPPRTDNVLDQVETLGRGIALWWLVPDVLAVAGAVLLLRRRRSSPRQEGVVQAGLLALAVVTMGGLSLLIVVERYLWPAQLAVLPVAVVAVAQLLGGRARRLAGLLLVLSLAAVSAYTVQDRVRQFSAVDETVTALQGSGERVPGRLAGVGSWPRSQLLCARLGCQYWGATGAELTGEPLLAALRSAGIDYLVRWPTDPAVPLPRPAEARLPGGALLYAVTPAGLVPAPQVAGAVPGAGAASPPRR